MSQKPFEQIVAAHGPTVLRVCRALLGPTDAEDAWSETFLAALAAYPRLRADSNVEAWLVTIAHRKALDHLRAASRRPTPRDPLPERAQNDRSLAGWEIGLWPALKALPARQRQAIAYHHLVGLSYREVARIVGGTEAGARRAAADGIAMLRRTFKGGESR
ncbi:MAG TPA: RNA polymerase sigma factor [Vicinamibacteria bacterium]|nr:RNA polymerase sigma factor [Vicinamibacteria bacterium]